MQRIKQFFKKPTIEEILFDAISKGDVDLFKKTLNKNPNFDINTPILGGTLIRNLLQELTEINDQSQKKKRYEMFAELMKYPNIKLNDEIRYAKTRTSAYISTTPLFVASVKLNDIILTEMLLKHPNIVIDDETRSYLENDMFSPEIKELFEKYDHLRRKLPKKLNQEQIQSLPTYDVSEKTYDEIFADEIKEGDVVGFIKFLNGKTYPEYIHRFYNSNGEPTDAVKFYNKENVKNPYNKTHTIKKENIILMRAKIIKTLPNAQLQRQNDKPIVNLKILNNNNAKIPNAQQNEEDEPIVHLNILNNNNSNRTNSNRTNSWPEIFRGGYRRSTLRRRATNRATKRATRHRHTRRRRN